MYLQLQLCLICLRSYFIIANYDALLKGWSTQTLQSGVTFSGGKSKYCEAETERQSIIDNFGWTITDGGKAGTPVLEANFRCKRGTLLMLYQLYKVPI